MSILNMPLVTNGNKILQFKIHYLLSFANKNYEITSKMYVSLSGTCVNLHFNSENKTET